KLGGRLAAFQIVTALFLNAPRAVEAERGRAIVKSDPAGEGIILSQVQRREEFRLAADARENSKRKQERSHGHDSEAILTRLSCMPALIRWPAAKPALVRSPARAGRLRGG